MVALLIEDQEGITKRLFELGYLWDIKQQELLDLAPGDIEFKTAVMEMQNTFRDEYELSHGLHHDKVLMDVGDVGPAFMDVLNTPRICPLPDIPPPPGVKFAYDDVDLQKAVESQQRGQPGRTKKLPLVAQDKDEIVSESKGKGSWPYGCWSDEGYVMHRLVVAVKHSSMPAYWKGHWNWLTERCRINYSWGGIRIDFVDWEERSDTYLQFRGGGRWIGLAEFGGNSCTNETFVYLKPSYQPSNRVYMLNLVEHELGHTNNFQHTNGGIMNPTINLTDSDWRNDKRWSQMVRQYGGKGNPDMLRKLGDNVPGPIPPIDDKPIGQPNGVFSIDGELYQQWIRKM